jgi:DNA-binding protein HU-beta
MEWKSCSEYGVFRGGNQIANWVDCCPCFLFYGTWCIAGSVQFTAYQGVLMTKTELIASVSESSNLSKKDVQAVVDGFLAAIENSLKNGEKVALVGFGTFETAKREARTGRNPQTGLALDIPAKTVPKFSAGKTLRDALS